MKIWGHSPKIVGVDNKQKNVSKVDKSSGVASRNDVVSISNHAKDFQTVMRALKEVPDMRRDKVDELAEKYESGNYNVDGKTMAEKMIQSIIDKRV